MKNCKTLLLALALAAFMPAVAQETFDLASQRKEVQKFKRVPGEKIDHKGIIINPTPQSLVVAEAGELSFADGFRYTGKTYDADLRHLAIPIATKGGAQLTIKVGEKDAAKAGVEAKKGAYALTIDKKGVQIVGFDDAGAFYGLQTLRELINSPVAEKKSLPYLTVNDFPDLPYRGVVEGFYGNPWSHDVRLSLIEFYGRNKMNDYIYGPKDDPYHSSPYWRQPYPEAEAAQIHDLVGACKRNRVNFVWAIHPGKDIRWDKADYDSLVAKFDAMYDLGVRSFAIFFDDIEGKGTDSNLQAELLNDLTRDFVKKKGDVTNLIICPTDYSQAWANPGPKGQLAIYGEKLNPDVEVFWTGAAVCSDLTPQTMEFINSRIKRPGLFWWNFPVNDYCRNYILQGPAYGLDPTLTAAEVAGIESNPMEQGEASKIALYGVADYAWNTTDYNPIDNWERSFNVIAPEAPEAYRTFAINSADTETGYRRDESWETETFPFNDYTPAQFDALRAQFAEMQTVPERMEALSNKQLLTELRPWLVEFGKIGKRGEKTLDLIKTFEGGDDAAFWTAYVDNLMSDADRAAFEAHKSGTMKLQPFYENAMDDMLSAFYKRLTGEPSATYLPIGSYRNIGTTISKLMLDNDTTTFYTSAYGQRLGDWIGLDLGAVRPVDEIVVLQGRNNYDDVDYFDNVVLEASADGKTWKALTDSLEKTYDIVWNGEPVDARYVRIRKLHSKKQNWASVREFRVNPPSHERLGLNVESPDMIGSLLAFDGNPATVFASDGTLAFDRPAGANSATLLLGHRGAGVTLKQLDDHGCTVETRPLDSDLVRVTFAPEAARIVISGPVSIFEIIPD